MATMNVSLPDPMKAWVEEQTRDGVYSNASDYVRDLIRKDQEKRMAIEALQRAVTEGIQSGVAQPFDSAAFKREMHAKYADR
ncbi:type II toxin-antitoxin system ParD family antitoxin [Maritalea sp.]|jgi:antitoxin ParD1/3/4|uniref:type II toxin-antitoxin system ParD family antitoxin n=1 Tax=Maritalea sp. TaxID=2003361 RepID=UPI0039E29F56